MTLCDEETAVFMGQSLLNHARAIARYAQTYCARTSENEYLGARRATFAANLDRMLKELYGLMLLAKYNGISRHCNREQVEAYMECAAEALAPAERSADLQGLLG